ncbi:MAG: hypothetical protein R3B49_00255 [Phycisphaerales bacterium]
MRSKALLAGVAVLGAVFCGGCVKYQTPGAAADFRALGITPAQQEAATDGFVRTSMSIKPAASFPARVAIGRVQDQGYRSYTQWGYGRGRYTLVGVRDVEREEDLERLTSLPMIADAVMLNRMAVPDQLDTIEDMRGAAASVHADMLLLYTFDTRFGAETTIPALGVITLGLFPNKEARVTSTASAALVDTRTGYVYGLVEGTASEDQLANAWTSRDAIDQSRRRAERAAFEHATDEFTKLWKGVAERYAIEPTRRASATVEAIEGG